MLFVYHKNASRKISDLQERIDTLEKMIDEKTSKEYSADLHNTLAGSLDNSSIEGLLAELNPDSDPALNDYPSPQLDFLPDFWQPVIEFADSPEQKTAYLTFDDGPSEVTLGILDTLDEYDIKGTFFVISRQSEREKEILQEIADRGHSIGMHSTTHDTNIIYKSSENYLLDLYDNYKYIYEVTGEYPQIFRFVGGSKSKYNKHAPEEILSEIKSRGFNYFDWNSTADDALLPYPNANQIVQNVMRTVSDQNQLVVLAHDSRNCQETAKALPQIIELLIEKGYVFDSFKADTNPIRF